jgi:hypothetical protein
MAEVDQYGTTEAIMIPLHTALIMLAAKILMTEELSLQNAT